MRPREARTLSPSPGRQRRHGGRRGCRRPRATEREDSVCRKLAFAGRSTLYDTLTSGTSPPHFTACSVEASCAPFPSAFSPEPHRFPSSPKNVRRRGREPARSAREQDGARGGHPPREEDLRARGASVRGSEGAAGYDLARPTSVYVSKPRFRSRGRDAGETRVDRAPSRAHASTTRDRSTRWKPTFSNATTSQHETCLSHARMDANEFELIPTAG